MKFIDLNQQYREIKASVDARIQAVLNHGQYIMGPEVRELEARLAQFVGVKHCIAMSSGTTALQLALMAVGIKPGDEVITTPFSFFASGETIVLLGGKPVFVDIDSKTYNLNPELLEAAITPRTKAIMPVNLYGQCADFDRINSIAEKHGIPVIEDAAQSFGATYRGRRSCSLSTIACTSFFPSKPLGCYGDGGACFTDDDELAHTLRLLVHHGEESRYHHVSIGVNGRFDTIQAAVLLAKLEVFEAELSKRQQVATAYNNKFKGQVIIPYVEPHNVSSYAQYTIRVNARDELQAQLKDRGIPTAVHYPALLSEQPALKAIYPEEKIYPVAQTVARDVLSLPFHPYLENKIITEITDNILSLLSRQSVNA